MSNDGPVAKMTAALRDLCDAVYVPIDIAANHDVKLANLNTTFRRLCKRLGLPGADREAVYGMADDPDYNAAIVEVTASIGRRGRSPTATKTAGVLPGNGGIDDRRAAPSSTTTSDMESDESNFSTAGLAVVNAEVRETIVQRFQKLAVTDKMKVLQQYSDMKHKLTEGIPSALFENVVAYHLTSEGGVKWHARIVNVGPREEETVEGTVPLHLQLSAFVTGTVPQYAAMEPKVLYKSASSNFPMCDLVYKDEEGKLVCIQVSLERKGARTVDVGAFQAFCVHMGWGASPSADQRRLMSFVYCPNPKIADKARVEFSGGVDLDSYIVWHVNADFGSG